MSFKHLCIILTASSFLLSCGSKGEQARQNICFDPSWPSVATGSKRANLTGYMIDLATIELDRAYAFGVEPELFVRLEQGDCSAVITSVEKTPELEERFDFSEPLLLTGPLFVRRDKESIEKLSQLSGQKIALLAQSPAYTIAQSIPDGLITTYTDISKAFEDLDQGAVDTILVDALTALSYVDGVYKDRLHIASRPMNKRGIHIVVLKGKKMPKVTREELSSIKKRWGLSLPQSS